MCVKHDILQRRYENGWENSIHLPKKNWSSLVLWNCGHPSNKKINTELVNDPKVTGKFLHRFSWLEDDEIGEISHEWNWLVGWYQEPTDETKSNSLY